MNKLTRRVELAAEVVGAYVMNNPVPMGELPQLIERVHAALAELPMVVDEPKVERPVPAVPIRKSITPDYLVSLEDGKRYKSLKRALSVRYGMTPDEYRKKWGLPRDYPMVAPNYAAARSELAKKMGLGRKPGSQAPAKRRRTPKAA